MNEIDGFASFQKFLVARGTAPVIKGGASDGDDASRRVGVILRQLLLLGIELRAELPDPAGYLHAAGTAAVEAAVLIAPKDSVPQEAIDRLAELQKQRLIPQIHQGAPGWRRFTAEMHLMRAFWQLCGLGLEVVLGSWRDGQLEEHAADLANYLVFATWTSGAWEIALVESLPETADRVAEIKARARE